MFMNMCLMQAFCHGCLMQAAHCSPSGLPFKLKIVFCCLGSLVVSESTWICSDAPLSSNGVDAGVGLLLPSMNISGISIPA